MKGEASIADYVFYPVTGDGKTQATGFTWNTGTINFNTGTDWAAVTFFNTLTIAGSVTTGIVPTTGDNIGLIAGEISYAIFALYKPDPDPAKGKPFINSNTYSVDVLLNSGSIELGSMVLGGGGRGGGGGGRRGGGERLASTALPIFRNSQRSTWKVPL